MSDHVQAIRHFNRVYTHSAGLLKMHKDCNLPLAEARILYEIGSCMNFDDQKPTASSLCQSLDLDEGYVSRILSKFQKCGWIVKIPKINDGRQLMISLTEEGKEIGDELIEKANELAKEQISFLDEEQRKQLLNAMKCIENLSKIENPISIPSNFFLRSPIPGDLGWVIEKHGEIYSKEYGWNSQIEAVSAQIVADFINNHDQSRERCWIAVKNQNQKRVGCIFLVKGSSEESAKIRLLLLTPESRGLGLGKHLLETCLSFAKEVGYKRVELWTNNVLIDARRLYERYGFKVVSKEEHSTFGPKLVSETWIKEF